MKVSREALLKTLVSLTPGLVADENIQQSSCIVFTDDGRAMTFNEEVCASRKSPLNGIFGAIQAKPLLDLLGKLTEDDIAVESVNGELQIKGKGKGRKAGIKMEASVLLPVDEVEVPENWKPLDPFFSEAVSIVSPCTRAKAEVFCLMCVHIHSDFMEATDKFQIARYPLQTGLDRSILVRAESLRKILGYDMTEFSETSAWLHFRNPTGLVISIRRDLSDYPDLDGMLKADGTEPMTLPGGLLEAVAKAEIFSAENVRGNRIGVDLRPGWLVVEGDGVAGWYKERLEVVYDGPPLQFKINPKLLAEIMKRGSQCRVSDTRLFVDGGKFLYASSTVVAEAKPVEKDD